MLIIIIPFFFIKYLYLCNFKIIYNNHYPLNDIDYCVLHIFTTNDLIYDKDLINYIDITLLHFIIIKVFSFIHSYILC